MAEQINPEQVKTEIESTNNDNNNQFDEAKNNENNNINNDINRNSISNNGLVVDLDDEEIYNQSVDPRLLEMSNTSSINRASGRLHSLSTAQKSDKSSICDPIRLPLSYRIFRCCCLCCCPRRISICLGRTLRKSLGWSFPENDDCTDREKKLSWMTGEELSVVKQVARDPKLAKKF